MSEENYCKLIVSYKNEEITARSGTFRKSFEIYELASGELAWSPYKDGFPHINPQKGVRNYCATELDIGKILSQMSLFELKGATIPSFLMVNGNKDLVARILNDIKARERRMRVH